MELTFRPDDPSDVELLKQVFIREEYKYDFAHPINTILDLGRNIGYASAYFRMRYPEAQIAEVEPDSDNYHRNDGVHGPTFSFFAAIGPEFGLCKLSRPSGDDRHMSVRAEMSDEGNVPVITVVQIMAQLNWQRISLVKCDIEGGEDDLFCRENDWLHLVDAVMVELHEYIRPGVVTRVRDALAEKGLHWVANVGENAVFERELPEKQDDENV